MSKIFADDYNSGFQNLFYNFLIIIKIKIILFYEAIKIFIGSRFLFSFCIV